jgi:hypothetical protein
MSNNYKGLRSCRVEINKPDAITHGSVGIVVEYDTSAYKYDVDFNNGFHGWYKLDELKVLGINLNDDGR